MLLFGPSKGMDNYAMIATHRLGIIGSRCKPLAPKNLRRGFSRLCARSTRLWWGLFFNDVFSPGGGGLKKTPLTMVVAASGRYGFLSVRSHMGYFHASSGDTSQDGQRIRN